MSKELRKAKRQEQIKKEIVEAAIKIFNVKGVKDITMDEIAAEALYSKAALYQYFGCKEEIIMCICNDSFELLLSSFEEVFNSNESGLNKIIKIGFKHYTHMKTHNNNFEFINNLNGIDYSDSRLAVEFDRLKILDMRIFEILNSTIIEGIKEGSIRSDLNSQTLSILLKAMSEGVYNQSKQIDKTKELHLKSIEGDFLYQSFIDLIYFAIKGEKL